MEKIEKTKKMTFEEALQDPSLAHVHDALRWLEKAPFSEMFPKKHELSLTHLVETKTNKLFKTMPNMSILKVITTIFEPLTDDISPTLALKLTQKIVATWEKLSTPTPKKKKALTTV